MILGNGKVQYLKYNKKYLKFLSKHFAEHTKEKPFPNDPSFLINLKNVKQILSWQSKYLQTYLLAYSDVLHFSTKKEFAIILKMTKFWRKNIAIFYDVKK